MSEQDPRAEEGRPHGVNISVQNVSTTAASASASAKAGLFGRPLLAWIIAGVMTVLAVAFAAMWAPLYLQNADREEVREAAEDLVLHLTTFEGESIDEWVQETQRQATDEYAAEVNALFDPELRAALRDAQAKSVGRLVNLFVQDVDGDDAMVFAVVRQTITNAQTSEPVEDELRMQIELRADGGRWKAAKVEVLGPQGSGQGGGALVDEAPADAEAAP